MLTLKLSNIRTVPQPTDSSSLTLRARSPHPRSVSTSRRPLANSPSRANAMANTRRASTANKAPRSRSGRRHLAAGSCTNCKTNEVSPTQMLPFLPLPLKRVDDKTTAVMWRRHPASGEKLCNRCGLYVCSHSIESDWQIREKNRDRPLDDHSRARTSESVTESPPREVNTSSASPPDEEAEIIAAASILVTLGQVSPKLYCKVHG